MDLRCSKLQARDLVRDWTLDGKQVLPVRCEERDMCMMRWTLGIASHGA